MNKQEKLPSRDLPGSRNLRSVVLSLFCKRKPSNDLLSDNTAGLADAMCRMQCVVCNVPYAMCRMPQKPGWINSLFDMTNLGQHFYPSLFCSFKSNLQCQFQGIEPQYLKCKKKKVWISPDYLPSWTSVPMRTGADRRVSRKSWTYSSKRYFSQFRVIPDRIVRSFYYSRNKHFSE